MTRRQPLPGSAAGTIIAILAVLVLAADQFVKYLTITYLPEQKVVPVIGEFLQLFSIRNSERRSRSVRDTPGSSRSPSPSSRA